LHDFASFQTDKTRVVDENTGRIWANNCGFYYFETSAQTGDGVNKMFQVVFVDIAITKMNIQ
jgi:DnaJ family protein C protein 27